MGMNNFLKQNKFPIFIIGIIALISLYFLDLNRGPVELKYPQQEVHLEITHPTLPIVDFFVPTEYLGPKFLELSKKNSLGGKQERFLIEFYYPSLLPITSDNPTANPSNAAMYASITTSIKQTTRNLINSKTELPSSRYKSTNEICGLKKYEELPDFYIGNTLYHHFDELNPINDIHINCGGKLCRMIWVTDYPYDPNIFISVILNGVPPNSIYSWKPMTQKVNELIKGFYNSK